jgi:hypothetical protein
VNGQNFIVFGGNIWVMAGYHPVGQLTRDSMWSVKELIDAQGELFKDAPSSIAPFSIF